MKRPKLKSKDKASPVPRTIALAVSGIEAPVELKRHPNARRMTLRVHQARRVVLVTMPMRCRIEEADRFLRSHIDWIQRRLRSLPQSVEFVDGIRLPIRGILHSVVFEPQRRGGPVVEQRDERTGAVLSVRGTAETAPRRLMDWLVEEARRDLDAAVLVHARRLGLRPRKLSIRDQGSRWGSCSSTGALSFSWRLVMAPPHVLDYVAAHEVAHLKEMNHSARFWALVKSTMPDMDVARAWLNVHGLELHRFSPRHG
ncbi:MAG TPA: SprT family zinc-dependent metalloprotease [Hyphomicrobiaceae bacterium]|nr:SprT family zinc-dependent metalloprotease [Hyphomicrobiaceae bacterium]